MSIHASAPERLSAQLVHPDAEKHYFSEKKSGEYSPDGEVAPQYGGMIEDPVEFEEKKDLRLVVSSFLPLQLLTGRYLLDAVLNRDIYR